VLLAPVARATHASTSLRARSMLLVGQLSEAKGEYEAAINNYLKIARFFESEADLAAEGLWRGAQLLEQQATGKIPMPEPKTVQTASRK
jgi:hypothetical protein